jgi:hypothetical protein
MSFDFSVLEHERNTIGRNDETDQRISSSGRNRWLTDVPIDRPPTTSTAVIMRARAKAEKPVEQ